LGNLENSEKIKIGAFLSKLMIENLKYMVGNHEE
jgi:hypothetical protein